MREMTDFFRLHVRTKSRRNRSLGLLLGAVAAWASCYIRGGLEAPQLRLLQSARDEARDGERHANSDGWSHSGKATCHLFTLTCLSARAPCFN